MVVLILFIVVCIPPWIRYSWEIAYEFTKFGEKKLRSIYTNQNDIKYNLIKYYRDISLDNIADASNNIFIKFTKKGTLIFAKAALC